jgi:hypothetical protein
MPVPPPCFVPSPTLIARPSALLSPLGGSGEAVDPDEQEAMSETAATKIAARSQAGYRRWKRERGAKTSGRVRWRRFVDAPDVYWGQDSFVNAWQATLIEPEHCDLERNGPRSQIPEVTMSSQFLSMMHLEVSGENAACTMM